VLDRIEMAIETVTPMFLHVEPDGEARWRAAPFRGLARWWFRAIVGAAWNLERVRQEEQKTFGTTERASPVMFRIENPTGRAQKFEINPGSQRSARRSALPPGSTATLVLQVNPWADDGRKRLRQVYAAVWTAIQLGGVGQRCRRGAGSLRIRSVTFPSGCEGLPGAIEAPDAKTLADAIAVGLDRVRRELGATPQPRGARLPDYPVLHAQSAGVQVSQIDVTLAGSQHPAEAARLVLMNTRRDGRWHQHKRPEPEFGGISPRLSSPLWLRIADVRADNASHRALVVASLLRHNGAAGAQWSRVDQMLASSIFKNPQKVKL